MARSSLTTKLLFAIWCSSVASVAARDVDVPKSGAFSPSWAEADFDHTLWTEVLSEYVNDEGLVNYAAIGKDERYREYLHRLANTNPADLANGTARLAFWINAYNALAIQGVLETLPDDVQDWPTYSVLRVSVSGIREKDKGFFAGLRF